MTDKDKKLAEEILVKRGFFVMTHKEGSEHVRKVFIDPVIEAMQEFAELWHTAKMREELIMFVMNEVDRCHYEDSNLKHTREEAENWIDEYLKQRNNDKD